MYVVTGLLYKNDKLLLRGMMEDLEDFIEELKKINPNFVNRKEFKILSSTGELIKEWYRR